MVEDADFGVELVVFGADRMVLPCMTGFAIAGRHWDQGSECRGGVQRLLGLPSSLLEGRCQRCIHLGLPYVRSWLAASHVDGT